MNSALRTQYVIVMIDLFMSLYFIIFAMNKLIFGYKFFIVWSILAFINGFWTYRLIKITLKKLFPMMGQSLNVVGHSSSNTHEFYNGNGINKQKIMFSAVSLILVLGIVIYLQPIIMSVSMGLGLSIPFITGTHAEEALAYRSHSKVNKK